MRILAIMAITGTVALAQTFPVNPSPVPATASVSPATAPSAPSTQSVPQTQRATQPVAVDAEKMLEQLLRAKPGTAKPLSPLPAEDLQRAKRHKDVAPDAPDVPLKREGDVISARIGRLQKAQREGDWEFVFESDGKTLQDPPITLLPNKALARMESTLNKSGMDLRFRLTGVITQYHGKNYLLIEKAEIVPDDF